MEHILKILPLGLLLIGVFIAVWRGLRLRRTKHNRTYYDVGGPGGD